MPVFLQRFIQPVLGSFFYWQGSVTGPERVEIDKVQLIKLSILPFIGVVAVILIFIYLREKLTPPPAKLSSQEVKNLELRMKALASQKLSERGEASIPDHPAGIGSLDIDPGVLGEVEENRDDRSIEGQPLF